MRSLENKIDNSIIGTHNNPLVRNHLDSILLNNREFEPLIAFQNRISLILFQEHISEIAQRFGKVLTERIDNNIYFFAKENERFTDKVNDEGKKGIKINRTEICNIIVTVLIFSIFEEIQECKGTSQLFVLAISKLDKDLLVYEDGKYNVPLSMMYKASSSYLASCRDYSFVSAVLQTAIVNIYRKSQDFKEFIEDANLQNEQICDMIDTNMIQLEIRDVCGEVELENPVSLD